MMWEATNQGTKGKNFSPVPLPTAGVPKISVFLGSLGGGAKNRGPRLWGFLTSREATTKGRITYMFLFISEKHCFHNKTNKQKTKWFEMSGPLANFFSNVP